MNDGEFVQPNEETELAAAYAAIQFKPRSIKDVDRED